LGRPSRITLRHTSDSFKVTVDGKPCFESSKIKLPLGNFFGLSAASAENPDSFEVFKFVTTTDQHAADSAAQHEIHDTNYAAAGERSEQGRGKPLQPPANNAQKSGDIPSYSEGDNVPASQFHSSVEQFADLHNRLQSMMKHIAQMNRHFAEEKDEQNRKHDALMAKLQSLEASIKIQEGTPSIMKDVQSDVRQTKADLHEALNQHAAGIKGAVQDTHHSVIGTMAKSGTGLGTFALVVVASQVVVVGAYVLYKRRKANGPKKYL
jgi:mannose-binding lectin 1